MDKYAETAWFVQNKRADFMAISKKFGISPVTARIIVNRGITTYDGIDRYLNAGAGCLFDSRLLNDSTAAAVSLCEDIKAGKKIRVVGDYDIDGVCAAFILTDGLRRAGAQVSYVIPDRVKDGYGINRSIVDGCVHDGIDTIITCDNGISAVEELKEAKDHGIKVIVTDHHDIKMEDGTEVLPPADFIISAKLKNSVYPEKEICGAVTAWKFLRVVYEELALPSEDWDSYYEFAGFATIGDVMTLLGENRIIAKEALRRLNASPKNRGLRALISENGLCNKNITCYHVGFVLGPCVNAAGRLETAEKVMELFLSTDDGSCVRMARELKEINDSRKYLTRQGTEEASAEVLSKYMKDSVLCVYLPSLHESMAGIVAGRLKETFGKPALVFTKSGEEGILKGSGRSIEIYNMFEALLREQELLKKFGGHPMAAGVSIKEENLAALREALNEHSGLTEKDLIKKVTIDAAMPMSYVSFDLLEDFRKLEPFGNGNEAPLFGEMNISPFNMRVLGKNRNTLRFMAKTSKGFTADCIMFGDADEIAADLSKRDMVSVLYYPEVNEYNGRRSIQYRIEAYK